MSWIALTLTIFVLISWRWFAFICCAALVVISFYPVVHSRSWSLERVDFEKKSDSVFRIVSCNLRPESEVWQEDLETLFSLNADVIVIIELPIEFNRSVRFRGFLDDSPYPYWAHRNWVDNETSPGFILSRWPMEVIETLNEPAFVQHHLYTRIQSLSGDIIVGLMHPKSPRTLARWSDGNQVIESQARAAWRLEKRLQIPVLIGADLNAGPAQLRSRTLRKARIRMSKPLARIGGSFPMNSSTPSFMRIQLDDIWSLGDTKAVAWDSIELLGSDHRAVVVDFLIIDGSDS